MGKKFIYLTSKFWHKGFFFPPLAVIVNYFGNYAARVLNSSGSQLKCDEEKEVSLLVTEQLKFDSLL